MFWFLSLGLSALGFYLLGFFSRYF